MATIQHTSSPRNTSSGGLAVRPSHRSYHEYLRQQRNLVIKEEDLGSPRLWRQMTIGFVCAACIGLVMLIAGSAFIAGAVSSENSVSIMLCVLGIVCGLIIVAGTAILGKLWISRKWRIAHGQQPSQNPPQQCFHTCSVINTPSQDQLAYSTEPPPAYETIMMTEFQTNPVRESEAVTLPANALRVNSQQVQAVMALPPKYSDVNAPIPQYGDSV